MKTKLVTRSELKDLMPEQDARKLFESFKKIPQSKIDRELNIIYHQPDADLSLFLFEDDK